MSALGTDSYVYGPSGVPVEQISGPEGEEHAQYLHHDQQGSTRLITNEAGEVVGSYTYGAYGEVTGQSGTATTPLGCDGQYMNSDTGLVYLRARSYEPRTAQFMSIDPLVALSRTPYVYAADNPLNYYDPTGKEFFADLSAVAGVGATVAAAIPGADITVAPFLAGVSFGSGAIAAGNAIGNGEYGAAAADGAGALLGGAGAGLAASGIGSGVHYAFERAGVVVPFVVTEGASGHRRAEGGGNTCGLILTSGFGLSPSIGLEP